MLCVVPQLLWTLAGLRNRTWLVPSPRESGSLDLYQLCLKCGAWPHEQK